MPQQFTVPQFIDAEDKILGPITIRQFVILLVAFMTDAVLYKLLPFVPFLLVAIPLIAVAGIIAFVKINGMPFHYFILNLLQTLKRPQLRVWDKTINDSELRDLIKVVKEPPPPPPERKAPVSRSRLNELTLVVNTGGLYKPEGE
ncbi:PrgI family protein [Patescibacteria group bacterium]|nr:PrgI family protein [Patescibacteria group bacterium]MBU1705730.1 PrgI family protein [Patescibacteria group bacterium]